MWSFMFGFFQWHKYLGIIYTSDGKTFRGEHPNFNSKPTYLFTKCHTAIKLENWGSSLEKTTPTLKSFVLKKNNMHAIASPTLMYSVAGMNSLSAFMAKYYFII